MFGFRIEGFLSITRGVIGTSLFCECVGVEVLKTVINVRITINVIIQVSRGDRKLCKKKFIELLLTETKH